MEATELKVCRLCLKVVCKNEYEIVEEKLVMVKTLFIDLNWAISENPIMCCECFEKLQNSCNFKSMCLTTEQHIKTVSKGKEGEVDLWQITLDNDHGTQEENKICRFCLKLNENTTSLNIVENEDVPLMLQKCLPELDLFMVQKPVICQNCYAALESLFNFVVSCLRVEESINIYRDTKGSNSNDKVNLYDVLQFTKIKEESDGGGICAEDFIGGSTFEKVFVKSEDIAGEELEVKSDYMKNEPLEYEVELENSVKLEDVETETQAPKRQKLIHKETFYPARPKNRVRQHIQGVPYVCNICHEKFNQQTYLDRHIIMKHSDSKQVITTEVHKCNICDFKTNVSMFLMEHVLNVHDNKDLKRYKCDECAYSTNHKPDWQRHDLTHKGTKPFVCPECTKDFIRKETLESHIFNQHSDKEEAMKLISSKIHYCKICDQSVYAASLQSHIETQHAKSVVCPKCSKDCMTKAYLDSHLLKWHSDKDTKLSQSFVCHKCSKCFMTKRYLDRHLVNQHIDKGNTIKSTKPFVCPKCSKGFLTRMCLDSHSLNQHSDKEDTMEPSKTFVCPK